MSPTESSFSPAPPALPRAHILSYVATADSPTRVRKIAARLVGIIAALHVLVAVVFLSILIWSTYTTLQEYHRLHAAPIPGWPPPALPDMLWDAAQDNMPWIVLFFATTTFGTALFACAKSVSRGKKMSCYMSIVALIPLMLVLVNFTIAFVANALLEGTRFLGNSNPEPEHLFFLIPAPVTLLLVMLLLDLITYLRWIAKNPITEKPAVPFLPIRSSAPSPPPKIQ